MKSDLQKIKLMFLFILLQHLFYFIVHKTTYKATHQSKPKSATKFHFDSPFRK